MSQGDDRQNLIREMVQPFAFLAPSPLNTRPWRVEIRTAFRAEVFIEPTRLLRNLDPRCRQALISTGAFIENGDLAARQAGYATDITYFPSGWPEPRLDVSDPVTRIDLTPDEGAVKDRLFPSITARWPARRYFRGRAIAPESFDVLSGSFDTGPAPVTFGYTDQASLKSEIADLLQKARDVELSDPARLAETLAWIRFPPSDSGPGPALRDLGFPALTRLYIRFMVRVLGSPGKESFMKRILMTQGRKRARSTAAYGWIASRDDHRITQLRAGRVFQRVRLAATSLGLSFRPEPAITGDYDDMQDLRERFANLLGIPGTHTIQMIFGLGY